MSDNKQTGNSPLRFTIEAYEQLDAELCAIRAENERLKAAATPICVGKPIIQILAKEGQWASESGAAVIAADCLFGKDLYQQIDELTAKCARLEEFAKWVEANANRRIPGHIIAEWSVSRGEIAAKAKEVL